MFRCIGVLLVSAMSLPTFLGCASTVTSNTPRTAKEQLLLSNSVDQALDKVDFTPLHSHRVFIDEKYLESVDKPYIVGSVRHRALRAGAVLADKVEDADIVMEVRSGGVGTDTSESYLGTPEIALPGMLTVPEIRLVERKTQFGYSKIGLVTYDAKSKQSLGDGGVSMAQSDDSNWFMFGVGPFQNGSLRKDVSRARINPPGMRRRELPSTVALAPRSDYVDGETAIRYASDSREVDGQ
ncbi:MAG: hypothetical protein KDA89_00485 [Planctomycetaceae bacterium]|nr:hypothetical protein [Planctomycetaceae bacterium]